MFMKPNFDLETILQRAPRPEPPEDFFATLEKQIKLDPAPGLEMPPSLWRSWQRLWIPIAGIAAAAAILIAVVVLFSAGTSRSFADTFRLLTKVKSFHLVERKRDGPPAAVVGPRGM